MHKREIITHSGINCCSIISVYNMWNKRKMSSHENTWARLINFLSRPLLFLFRRCYFGKLAFHFSAMCLFWMCLLMSSKLCATRTKKYGNSMNNGTKERMKKKSLPVKVLMSFFLSSDNKCQFQILLLCQRWNGKNGGSGM